MNKIVDRLRIGLALGSGSARGFAHIGVIQALKENDIPIDCICGCSAGAIIGSIYCAGGDLNLFAKLCHNLMPRDFLDLTVPRKGLVKGHKFEELLRISTRGYTFDQMQTPFTCVATDLEAGLVKVFNSGKVYPAVRASMSIPGIFEPKTIDGIRYIDGGILAPVPVSYTRAMGADVVIAVDVGLHAVKPTKVIDDIWHIFMRAQELMGAIVAKEEIDRGDVVVVPDVSAMAAYSSADALWGVQLGYEAALRNMNTIKKAASFPIHRKA